MKCALLMYLTPLFCLVFVILNYGQGWEKPWDHHHGGHGDHKGEEHDAAHGH